MKELHLFYAPELASTGLLPEDEAVHALRVLRMQAGDAIWVTDGRGSFFEGTIGLAGSNKHPQCLVSIVTECRWQRPWASDIFVGVAPTKNIDRIEWMVEKATEIGCDGFRFLHCANSERKVLKEERIEKIVVSATKQSHKAVKPSVEPLTPFQKVIAQPFDGDKFIAHCYAQADIDGTTEKPWLYEVVDRERPTLVLIGPEGDFSVEEVRAAQAAGFRPVHLGESRLRTETAALVAVQLMNMKKSH